MSTKQTETQNGTPRVLAAGEEATSNAYHSHGTTLEYSKDGTTWKRIANLKNVTPPNVSTDEIETTDHDSNGWKEFISGLKDGGSMPFSVNVKDETAITEMFALAESAENVHWRITAPTKPKAFIVELVGFVKSFNFDDLVSGSAITATGEIRNSGQPKFGYKVGE